MLTTQRKRFPMVQTPRRNVAAGVLNAAIDSKGKAVTLAGKMTMRQMDSIRDNRFARTHVDKGYADDWRRFKEVGLLDEASMEKKDHEALLEKVSKLDKELFDYQHYMGLLLIEKRKWTSEHDELSQALGEVQELLKRERTVNLIALSEAQRREETLRKALTDEKQSVAELKSALRRLKEEHCQAKASYETELAEASSLIVGIDHKAVEVETHRHVAEGKLAEANRKNAEVEKKLKEVENRESLLERERLSLITERGTHEATVYKQREELSGWQKRLTVEEHGLSELKRCLNERRDKVVESEESLKQKEMSLDDEFRRKQEELEQQEAQINLIKDDLSKREAVLDEKTEEVEKKEMELEARWEYVREKEEFFEAEEQKLDAEKGSLGELKDEIEGIRVETTQRESRVFEELEKLKVTKEERLEFNRLQFELKQQMEKCKQQEELILMENEALRQERSEFEKERRLLDEKRASERKEELEPQPPSDSKRLKGKVQTELDHIKLHEGTLEATTVSENRKIEENEKDIGTRIAKFELRSKKQLGDIDFSKKLVQIDLGKVHSKRCSLERQKKEEQTEMHKNIDEQTEHVYDLALLDDLPSQTQIYDVVVEAGDEFETSAGRKVETPKASRNSDGNTSKPRRGKPKKNKTQSSLAIEGNPRKRQHGQTSKRAKSDPDDDEDYVDVHSLTAGGRRKKRQIMDQVSQSPVQNRYNLRSRKKSNSIYDCS